MIKNSIPKYQQIENDILEKIYQGVYAKSSKLPSENQMAELYKTSVPTVRKAFSELVHKRAIYRIKGSGTFVSADEIEEIPNTTSRQKSMQNICFLVFTDITDSSIMKMIRGAQMYLFDKGYSMTILCKSQMSGSESELIRGCLESNVDGIICFAEDPKENAGSFRMIMQHHIPVVMLDRGPSDVPFTLVSAYNVDGGYQIAKYLLDIGHQKIVFAADTAQLVAEKDRLKGYRMALAEAGIPYDEKLVLEQIHLSTQQDKLIDIIRKHEITAVQCVNDKMAVEVMRKLKSEGYHVPEDISVCGFDGSDEAQYASPRITTINHPFEEMGRVAASKLLSLLGGKKSHSQTYLAVELEVKDSTCPPKQVTASKQEKSNT